MSYEIRTSWLDFGLKEEEEKNCGVALFQWPLCILFAFRKIFCFKRVLSIEKLLIICFVFFAYASSVAGG